MICSTIATSQQRTTDRGNDVKMGLWEEVTEFDGPIDGAMPR
jgi:hypothetical protein